MEGHRLRRGRELLLPARQGRLRLRGHAGRARGDQAEGAGVPAEDALRLRLRGGVGHLVSWKKKQVCFC